MVTELMAWGIFLLPLLAFLLICLVIRPFFNRGGLASGQLSGYLLIATLAVSLALSLWALARTASGNELDFAPRTWLDLGDAAIEVGLLLDPVTAIMLVVVSGVSLLVQVYSLGYMREDPGTARYFAYMALFTSSMLGLTMSANVVQLYAFWELVGLSSYLLIGFWHDRPAAAAAAKKAFIVTRIGDVGFLLAIIALFFHAPQFAAEGFNALHIPDIWQATQPLASGGAILGGAALTWICLGIFAGAAGKSGQFPLHSWLPDAMEGPTPVSALIHAATMVAAGVFLVARFFPLFQEAREAMMVVALIGGFTAFAAATLGLVMDDIKRVMAYSTVSQLGYMMAALGLGAFGPALFHLFTHAFFKALLFLGSGSVNHAVGTFNMRYMGGLRSRMPWTYTLTLIGGLSLVGIVPLAGFWSKDEILTVAWLGRSGAMPWVAGVVFLLLAAGVVLTAFYTIRMISLTFHGEFRGGGPQEQADLVARGEPVPPTVSGHVHLAESPWVMVAPMVALGVGSVVAGYLVNPQWVKSLFGIPGHWFSEFVESALIYGHGAAVSFNWMVAGISTLLALVGIVLAFLVYARSSSSRTSVAPEAVESEPVAASEEHGAIPGGNAENHAHSGHPPIAGAPAPDALAKAGPVYLVLTRKYFVDELYEGFVVRRIFYRYVAGLTDWLDRNLVDGVVEVLAWLVRQFGRLVAHIQTGQVQFYGTVIVLGAVIILLGYLFLGAGLGG